MAVNDTYELALRGTYHGQAIITTHHFREYTPVATPPAIEQQLVDQWQAGCQAAWIAAMLNTYTLSSITAQKVCGTLPLPVGVEEAVGLAGGQATAAATELPAWLALVVQERTALRGRSYRGRFFIPCVTDNDITGDAFVTTAGGLYDRIGTYLTALNGLFGSSGTDPEFRLVVHSRKLSAVPGTQCQNSSTPIISLTRSLIPATMKSRKA